MISKELLNKVLNIEIVSYQMKQKNILAYEYNKVSKNQWSGKTFCNRSINIYELSHKCKKWAFKNGYWLSVRLYEPNGFNIVIFSHIHSQLQKDLKEINDKTEPEAIFKACQWILEQKGIK